MKIKYANEFSYDMDTNSGMFDLYKGTSDDFILFISVQITCPDNYSNVHLVSWYAWETSYGTAELSLYKPFSQTIHIYGYIVVASA